MQDSLSWWRGRFLRLVGRARRARRRSPSKSHVHFPRATASARSASAPYLGLGLIRSWIFCIPFHCFILASLPAQDALKVEGARIEVTPSPGAQGLLEILDASGACVKTLHAGDFSKTRTFTMTPDMLAPGSYRVRYREGLNLAFDTELLLPKKERWVNPMDIALTSKGVYVLDRGMVPGDIPAKSENAAAAVEQGATCVHKFTNDGKPDPSFGDRGRATISEKPCNSILVSVVADDSGNVYIPTLENDVLVLDPSGTPSSHRIGGADAGARNTQWAGALTLGPNRLIYIFSGGLCAMSVYDRAKNGFDGFSHGFKTTRGGTTCRSISSDRQGAIYVTTVTGHLLQKITDSGKELKETYTTKPEDKMYLPMGPSANGDLVWVADHGPGAGPFWDSGGGGEVLLFWDNGRELALVGRYGTPGKAKDKLEFINPCSTAQTPDHLGLWVVEDGLPNEDGPPGNARIRKFKITSTRTEEAPLEIKKP